MQEAMLITSSYQTIGVGGTVTSDFRRSDLIHLGVLASSDRCPQIAFVKDIFDSPRSRDSNGMGTSATL